MNGPVLLLCLLSYILLGSLPLTFFRRGRFNAAWFMTAAPFVGDAALIIAALTGALTPSRLPLAIGEILAYHAVALVAGAIALIGCTIGVHRVPLSLWHQDNDTPAALVTFGPYARIRHPFYAAFILMLAGTAAAVPHPGTLALLVIGTLQLHRTARREERRLLASQFGAEYAAYMSRTGRFLPRLSSGTHRLKPLGTRA
jgi:protein-S-isoprenylcysteine O-methyltransferase Ste14